MIYCYPRLSDRDFLLFRFLGPGLGNLLFPWARALVHANRHGYQLITPTWPQVKLGTLIRRESDARMYSDLFIGHPSALSGSKRIRKLLNAPRIPELRAADARDGDIIEFRGMEGMFSSFLQEQELIRGHLLAMTRPTHLCGISFDFRNSISLHVRLGDFAVAESKNDLSSGKTNTRIPLAWYIDMVEGIRRVKGDIIPAYVFSDGTDQELAPLTALSNCRRIGFGSAIADMLALSNANILVASGSTFSMWASYLGQPTTIWYPGQKKQDLCTEPRREFEARDSAELVQMLST